MGTTAMEIVTEVMQMGGTRRMMGLAGDLMDNLFDCELPLIYSLAFSFLGAWGEIGLVDSRFGRRCQASPSHPCLVVEPHVLD